jgi:hypothetical protein
MEKQPHQEYRDELAKDLKKIRNNLDSENPREDAKKHLKDEKSNHADKYKFAEVIHNLEREKRDISDQAIGFLSEHNLSEISEEDYETFIQYLKPRKDGKSIGLTYSKGVSPILTQFASIDQQRLKSIEHHLEFNKKYWEAKEHWDELSAKDKEVFIELAPYGHGAMVSRIGSVFNSELFNEGIPSYVTLSGGYNVYKMIFSKILAKIDRGEIENSKISNNFKNFYDLYLDSISRLITLAVRDTSWRFDDLNNYLIENLGKEKFDTFELYCNQDGEFNKTYEKIKNFNVNDLEYFENLSSLLLEAWKEINNYLREKVNY